jgi:carbon storage regulator
MLVLSRQKNQEIIIGDNIHVFVLDVRGERVRIGVQAAPQIPVHRREVYDAIDRGTHKEGNADG